MSVSAVSSSSAASYLQQAKQLGAAKIGDPIDPLTEWQSSTATADASVTGATAPSGSTPPFGQATMDSLISAQGQATTGSEEDPGTKPAHPHGHHHHVADSDAASSASSSSTSSSGTSSAASIGEDPIDPGIAGDSDATIAASTTGSSNSQSISSLMEQLGKMQSQVAGVVAPIVSAIV
jgi:hypothetical protein